MANALTGGGAGPCARSDSIFWPRFFKGYWQSPLHPSCQEMFSFLTDLGVYTPTRVLMGEAIQWHTARRRSRRFSTTCYTGDY